MNYEFSEITEMLCQVPTTIPAENRDYPEWHHGRETYAVWVLQMENQAIQEKFKAAREHLSSYLLEPYHRQPHITLFVCGFLVDESQYNDDFTQAQLGAQMQALEKAKIQPFEIAIGGLNSFASAPFLEVHDPEGGIAHLREILASGAREFRTAPYTPHLTVGLYAGAFPSEDVARRLAVFSSQPIRWEVNQITLATYKADEFAGRLNYKHNSVLRPNTHNM
jgi:2'-5' RNA ligase